MKKILLAFILLSVISCNNDNATAPDKSSTAADPDNPPGLPYTASYTSHWSTDVTDADLKTVLQSYKDWETGNMPGLAAAMADTVDFDEAGGTSFHLTRDSLMKMWSSRRDSLRSVTIDMGAWHKMHATDKKDDVVVTWYKETDVFKDGRTEENYYSDINLLKNGKIVWYSQYKRPVKK